MSEYIQSQLNKSKKDKFLLVFELPKLLRDIKTSDLGIENRKAFVNRDAMQFAIYGSIFPGIRVAPIVAGYGGGSYHISSHNREPYEPVRVNFTVDNRMNNYWTIYQWLNHLSDDEKVKYFNRNTNFIAPKASGNLAEKLQPSFYQTDFTIFVKDEFDVNIAKFTYTKAFPTYLAPINYNYRDAEDVECEFEFAFSQFYGGPVQLTSEIP